MEINITHETDANDGNLNNSGKIKNEIVTLNVLLIVYPEAYSDDCSYNT